MDQMEENTMEIPRTAEQTSTAQAGTSGAVTPADKPTVILVIGEACVSCGNALILPDSLVTLQH